MARKARAWKGARIPSALKRARQALRRRAVNRRTRSEAKTLVLQATSIAAGRSEGDPTAAVAAAISALDKAAEKGIIHPNNAARRKSRMMDKVNASHALDTGTAAGTTTGRRRRTTAGKTEQRKRVAAAKASKAAAARSADRPRTAAGKARVAVTRATRETSAAQRRTARAKPAEPPADSAAEAATEGGES